MVPSKSPSIFPAKGPELLSSRRPDIKRQMVAALLYQDTTKLVATWRAVKSALLYLVAFSIASG
jgi:hypothetical protein